MLQVVAGELFYPVDLRLRSHPRPEVHPANAKAGIAAAVGKAELQAGVAVQHAAKNQRGNGNGRVQREVNQVGQVVAAGAVGSRRVVRMEKYEGAQPFGGFKEGLKPGFVPVVALHVGVKFYSPHPQFLHRPFQLGRRRLRVLHRDGCQADEAVRVGPSHCGNLIVQFPGRGQTWGGVQVIIGQIRSHREDMNVHLLPVHKGNPLLRSKPPFLVYRPGNAVGGVNILNAVAGEQLGAIPMTILFVGVPKTWGHYVAVDVNYFHLRKSSVPG